MFLFFVEWLSVQEFLSVLFPFPLEWQCLLRIGVLLRFVSELG